MKLHLILLNTEIRDHATADNVLACCRIFYTAEGRYYFVIVEFHQATATADLNDYAEYADTTDYAEKE